MGFKDHSKYKKGEDVLVDAMLLSHADVFYRSRGNVSNFIHYMRRDPNMEVVDLVQVYERENPWVRDIRAS